MGDLQLIETRNINNATVDGYFGQEEVWFTRNQIGSALEYDEPVKAVGKIHLRHKERLDRFSRVLQFDTPSGKQEGFVYNIQGVFEICRWSRQPKADMIMDALYDMAMSIMRGEWERKPHQATKKVSDTPKLKKPEADWSRVAMLSLNRNAYTREEYYKHLVEIFDSDHKSIENEMKLHDGLRR